MDNPRVIVIEDDIASAREVQRELERVGYSVPAVFTSGEEALAGVREVQADLILLKLELEGYLEVAVVAKRLEESVDLPIVFVTAFHGEWDVRSTGTASSFGVLIRPFREYDLRVTIAYALHKHNLRSALVQSWNWMTAAFSFHEEGLIVSDQKGIIRFLNDYFLRYSGWTEEDVLGKPMIEFLSAGSDGVTMPPDTGANQLPDGMGTQLLNHGTLRLKDETKTPVTLRHTPILDHRGVVFGLWVVFSPDENPLAGQMGLSSALTSGVPSGTASRPLHEALSPREEMIFRLIVCGKSIKEISAELSLSPSTVSTYKNRILRKMRMRSTSELVTYAIRQNILR